MTIQSNGLKALFASLHLVAVLALSMIPAGRALALSPSILDHEHAYFTAEWELMLRANTDLTRPVVQPAVAFAFFDEDPRPEDAIIRLVVECRESVEFEMQAEYRDDRRFLMTRRLHTDQPGADSVLWHVGNAQDLTTVTLVMRAPASVDARLVLFALDDAASLGFGPRILAESSNPLRLIDPLEPVKDGLLGLTLQLPRGTEAEVLGAEVSIFVDGIGYPITIEGLRRDRDTGAIYADFDIPVDPVRDDPVSIYLYDDGTRRRVGEFSAHLTPAPWTGRLIADQSVQQVSAIVRNDELAVYTVTAPVGALKNVFGIPHPGETIWLSVTGDFNSWVVEQPVLRSRRDNPSLAGGVGPLALAVEDSGVVAALTVTTMDGIDTTFVASAANSLRVIPLSTNPISGIGWGADRHLGHALLRHSNARVLLTLTSGTGTERGLRAFASNQLPNWLSLGKPTTPSIHASDTEMSGFSHGSGSYLLVGKPWRLYSSENILFEWVEHPIDLPSDIQRVSLVQWRGALIYVGISERNGFGILRWGRIPAEQVPPGLKTGVHRAD